MFPAHAELARAIIPGAPREIAAALSRAGVCSRLSVNAGVYVCNATLYLSLARSRARVIGFIHVPRLCRARGKKKPVRSFCPSRDDRVRAAWIAILLSARKLRQIA